MYLYIEEKNMKGNEGEERLGCVIDIKGQSHNKYI